MEFTITTNSSKETANLGERLGRIIKKDSVIAFLGGMGSGKTCLTSGLCKGLDYLGDVTSPTFALVNEYLGGRLNVYHFDMYRINDDDELYALGFYDYLEQDGVCVVEWSENILSSLPENSIYISFKRIDDNKREITFKFNDVLSYLKELF